MLKLLLALAKFCLTLATNCFPGTLRRFLLADPRGTLGRQRVALPPACFELARAVLKLLLALSEFRDALAKDNFQRSLRGFLLASPLHSLSGPCVELTFTCFELALSAFDLILALR